MAMTTERTIESLLNVAITELTEVLKNPKAEDHLRKRVSAARDTLHQIRNDLPGVGSTHAI